MTGKLTEDIDKFLHHMANQRRVAANTVSAYHNDLRQFEEYLVSEHSNGSFQSVAEPVTIDGLDSGAVAGFVLHLREKGYAQATVARKVAAVKSFFGYASDVGLVLSNPTLSLDSPRVRRAIPQAVSESDVRALLASASEMESPDDRRNRAMLTLLYHTGMRVSELVALDLKDVDTLDRIVLCRGRGGRVRSIPMGEPAVSAIQSYLGEGRPFLARGVADNADALFLNHRGTRLTRQGFWLIMKDCARQAGITAAITPHTLRHSFALHRLGTGTTLRDLKELLGHVNISTTQIYALADRGANAARTN
ncbi:MAG: phage integrase family protein [Chloroflexi bacterium]|nr:phage integrase family protein [Chloroflexota bacterium]